MAAREGRVPYARHTLRDDDGSKGKAAKEGIDPYARHTIENYDVSEGIAAIVFASNFVSVNYSLKGRKVMTRIL